MKWSPFGRSGKFARRVRCAVRRRWKGVRPATRQLGAGKASMAIRSRSSAARPARCRRSSRKNTSAASRPTPKRISPSESRWPTDRRDTSGRRGNLDGAWKSLGAEGTIGAGYAGDETRRNVERPAKGDHQVGEIAAHATRSQGIADVLALVVTGCWTWLADQSQMARDRAIAGAAAGRTRAAPRQSRSDWQ